MVKKISPNTGVISLSFYNTSYAYFGDFLFNIPIDTLRYNNL
jgi:hypothetical protein